MAKKFGAAVSILMVCPIGSNNGNIELRRYVLRLIRQSQLTLTMDTSVHSGVTNELVPQPWLMFDRAGFEAMQTSMVNFGAHVFSKSDTHAYCTTNLMKPQASPNRMLDP